MSLILQFKNYFNSLTKPEHRAAWMIAVIADALQIAAFPLFAEGAISPADSLLDLIVAFMMIRLLGWHWAFFPTLAAELIPGADLFPTWTAAVWFVTRQQRSEQSSADVMKISGSQLRRDRVSRKFFLPAPPRRLAGSSRAHSPSPIAKAMRAFVK